MVDVEVVERALRHAGVKRIDGILHDRRSATRLYCSEACGTSSSAPVSTTPITRGPQGRAAERNSTSTEGRWRFSLAPRTTRKRAGSLCHVHVRQRTKAHATVASWQLRASHVPTSA